MNIFLNGHFELCLILFNTTPLHCALQLCGKLISYIKVGIVKAAYDRQIQKGIEYGVIVQTTDANRPVSHERLGTPGYEVVDRTSSL